ncbi:MAG: glycosyltransferase [Lachnospiraceae bacterium]|nr:glycosyltransferase [Lachnospiraceae bacterium]
MPKVSIIVIIYKVERFLKRCLESLVTQDYENIEIICVVGDKDAPESSENTAGEGDGGEPGRAVREGDGGEPGKAAGTEQQELPERHAKSNNVLQYYGENRRSCLELCQFYAKRDERVRVIREKPQGTAKARNTGLDAATGELIAFVDGDDFVEPTMISVMVNALQRNNADISIVGKYLEYENCADIVPSPESAALLLQRGDVTGQSGGGEKGTESILLTRAQAYEIIFYQTGFFLHIWDKLYKRELFDDVRFDIGKKVEDRYVTYKLLSKAEKIVFSPAPQYHFRISEDSGSKVADNLAQSFEADLLICGEILGNGAAMSSGVPEEKAVGPETEASKDQSEAEEGLLRAGEYFLCYEAMSVIQNDMLYDIYSEEHDQEYLKYVKAYEKSVKRNKLVGKGVKQKVTLCLKFPGMLSRLTKSRRKKFLKKHIPYKTDVNWNEIYREQGVK